MQKEWTYAKQQESDRKTNVGLFCIFCTFCTKRHAQGVWCFVHAHFAHFAYFATKINIFFLQNMQNVQKICTNGMGSNTRSKAIASFHNKNERIYAWDAVAKDM